MRRRTTIWIVADDSGAYVRSVRGSRGRWYRDLVANPDGAIIFGAERISIRAIAAVDADSIELVSYLFRAKYGRRSRASTESMVQPMTLETTLRLVPT